MTTRRSAVAQVRYRSEQRSRVTARRRQLRVVDQLEDLGELDARTDAVQPGHLLHELIREELAGGLLRLPHVDVRRSVPLLAEREELVAQTRHSFERRPRLGRDLAH